jgi:hypothetical protein
VKRKEKKRKEKGLSALASVAPEQRLSIIPVLKTQN